MSLTFSEPTQEDKLFVARNWLSVERLIREDYKVELDRSLGSLDLLQRVRDDDLVGEPGYVALGVALGRIMVKNIAGLDWWVVVDEFGRDLCLRYQTSTLRVNPVSMVVKRSAPDKRLDFRELFELVRKKVHEVGPIAD